jgi:hypothetical protein
MKRVSIGVTAAALALGSFVASAGAWWAEGHGHITEGAVKHLPQPLYAYFHANVSALAADAGQEPPGAHYIDIDYYPEFLAGTFPRDLNALIAEYGSSVVESNGTAPWTVGDYVTSLSDAMAAARTGRDWSLLLPVAGALAHYVEDLHNPLHLTENYNGQLTGNTGIHSRYEGTLISRNLSNLIITPSAAGRVYLLSPVGTVFDGIDVHYPFVQQIMDADSQSRGSPPRYNDTYYARMWTATGGFTQALFQEGSELTASVWYTAWVNAGRPQPIFAADFDADGDVDLTDFGRFQACFNGPNRQPRPDCLDADLDGDSDIDLADFNAFQACFNGPNRPPACQ